MRLTATEMEELLRGETVVLTTGPDTTPANHYNVARVNSATGPDGMASGSAKPFSVLDFSGAVPNRLTADEIDAIVADADAGRGEKPAEA